ncbi:NAD+ synthase [uncultured Desulfovibrio sp.]|uniref:NAD+ synthase n=1 Tax=uncultured Desulfovibrio sp. TaxID=167968 RepID=UPI00262379E4|nr:NAD+ synthase [uncultured Desulfovibrio sp.]
MKIALLQCNSVTGDVAGNQARILEAARRAAQAGADLCVTPELALCGVAPGQYLRAADFAQGCRAALRNLAEALRDGPPLLVGAPVPSVYVAGMLSNAAVLVDKGKWQVVSRKVYQNMNQNGDQGGDVRYFDRGVSCGILTLHGWRLGVALCEDAVAGEGAFWQTRYASGHNPLMELIQRGVDAVVHMAAAPFWVGAQEAGEHMLSHVAARHHVHLFSVNLVGGNDSRIYNGQSLAFDPTGQLMARGKAFAEDVLVVDTNSHDADMVEELCQSVEEAEWRALTLGTRDFVRKCGARRVVVGLSGGMDSALVCCIAAEALGADNVTGVLMPSPYSSEESLTDALQLADNLGVTTVTLPIEPLMRAFEATLKPGLDLFPACDGDVTFENVQARIRGTLLTSLANRAQALVLNTGNKSEGAVGYSTLYGDAVGALGVIADLTKTRVYAVARWYNTYRGAEIIPRNVFDKAPSAELRPGQKDTDSLPPYEELDPVLEALLEPSAERQDKPLDDLCLEVRHKLFRAEFKRRQEPPALHVSRTPFGAGWRAPVAGRYRLP